MEPDESLRGHCPCTTVKMFIDPYLATLQALGKFTQKDNAHVIAVGVEQVQKIVDGEGDMALSEALGLIVLATLSDWHMTVEEIPICDRLSAANERVREIVPLTVEDIVEGQR